MILLRKLQSISWDTQRLLGANASRYPSYLKRFCPALLS